MQSCHSVCMPIPHVMQTINAILTVVLNSYLSVKTKAQTIVITKKKKTCYKKNTETEKK